MRQTWTWHFDLPPERLWPVLADTNRFNEAMGLPPYDLEETPQANGTVLRRGKGKAAGFTLEWEEKPYEWVHGRSFRQGRVFSKGRSGPSGRLHDRAGGAGESKGSKVTYTLEWEPLTLIGRLFGRKLAMQAGSALEKRVLPAVEFVKGARPTMFALPPPQLPEGGRARAIAAAEQVDRSTSGNGLGRPFADHVMSAMASDLVHIKPKVLARQFGVAPRPAIEACLASVKAGLLTMKWDLLCTNCRGPKLSAMALSDLPRGAHCASCNIDYDRDFERNVELSFSPAPTVRPLLEGGYCLSGPMSTPHVPVQLPLKPGGGSLASIAPGTYRLRTHHPGTHSDVDHAGGAFGVRSPRRSRGLAARDAGQIEFRNDADFEVAA